MQQPFSLFWGCTGKWRYRPERFVSAHVDKTESLCMTYSPTRAVSMLHSPNSSHVDPRTAQREGKRTREEMLRPRTP